jgi:hypothetical protein
MTFIMTLEDPVLLRISVDKKSLMSALLPLSYIGKTASVGVLTNPDGGYEGIFFNRGVEQGESDYATTLYASCPIFDNSEHNSAKVSADRWPLFLASCSPQLMNAINALSPKNGDRFELTLSYLIDPETPNLAESHFIVNGEAGANVGSRIKHPVSLDEPIFKYFADQTK